MTTWNPADYHQHSSQQQKWAGELLPALALKGNESVLDIGCGDGKITARIASAVPHGQVLGIDASADMIAFALHAFLPATHPNLRFQQGDARSLSFHAQFDRVVSFACLHWVIDHRPMLAGIARALRPGGRTLLQFGGQGNAAEIVQTVAQITQQPAWADFFRDAAFPWGFYSPQQYLPWLEHSGLRPIRLQLVPKDMTHPGPAGLADWLRTTWMPYIQRVPDNLRQPFLDEVVTTYLRDHPPDESGTVHLNMMRLEVEAAKL